MKQKKIYPNGTPYSDEQWKNWYAHNSNKELFIEKEEHWGINEGEELKPDQQYKEDKQVGIAQNNIKQKNI